MNGQQRPPLEPMGSSSSTSSSSAPSMSALPTPDQVKSPFNTSPSGRVSFVFPQTNRSPSRAAPKANEPPALVELPSADIIPYSVSEPAPGRSAKVVAGPNRLRLVTDDALDSILGPSTRLGHSIYEQNQNSIQAWVETSKRTSREANPKSEE
ncbi:hypothetical protein RSOLAG1IB_06396 [Rhizoctonia solani AG-1 IB]|uniref:Uncharacterized protein n=1 Tax=Thanatephorus cucumeris (strain AG1-IB / isolate 7/3/14) TaxID=1108050 RepID=A0A0B7F652_THACB|nr:hypothetical protein RSOLAG1IB_06396 [Rhizoctonia solani AG-1 IB]